VPLVAAALGVAALIAWLGVGDRQDAAASNEVTGAAAAVGPWDLVVPWSAACAGFAASAFLGLAVGAIPAARAARLEPIVALRAS
jgi:ABC-type antimicrobial peptide transport system permease subunit